MNAVGGTSDLPLRLVVLAIVLLAVAIAKPWDWFAAATETGAAGTGGAVASASMSPVADAIAAIPSPTPPPTLPPGAIECLQPIGWRFVLLTQAADRVSKSWIVANPVAANGPDDTRLVPLVIAADQVVSVGFCADHQAVRTDPALIADAWVASGPGSWAPIRIEPSGPAGSDGGSAVTYAPPAAERNQAASSSPAAVSGGTPAGAASAGTRSWPTDDYVFEVTRSATTAWFRVQLIWPPRYIGASAGPNGAPAPSTAPAAASDSGR